jgi:hypothetical protein
MLRLTIGPRDFVPSAMELVWLGVANFNQAATPVMEKLGLIEIF